MNHFDFMDSYPSLAVLIQILATRPVTTATNKRLFSAFKYLKPYLQNTTKEERLNGLALLYVHRDISFGFEQVVTSYFILLIARCSEALRLSINCFRPLKSLPKFSWFGFSRLRTICQVV